MGWTSLGFHIDRDRKSVISAVTAEITGFGKSLTVVKATLHGWNELYLAVKNDKGRVFGVVVLLEWNDDNPRDNLMMKDMDEEQHPYYYNAGVELIRKLSVLGDNPNANALEWRTECCKRKGYSYNEGSKKRIEKWSLA